MKTNLDDQIELLIAKNRVEELLKEYKEIIKIMEAYKRGEQIQFCSKCDNSLWLDTDNPVFNVYDYEYRIKPKEGKRLLTAMELFELGATHIKTDQRIEVIAEFWGKNIRVATRLHEEISQLQERGARWTADRNIWHDFYKTRLGVLLK